MQFFTRLFLCLMFIALSLSATSQLCTAGTVPYTENFDGVTAPATPSCLIIENVNGFATWATAAYGGFSSPNVMRYSPVNVYSADDWFFIKGLTLTAGTAYSLSLNMQPVCLHVLKN